MVHRYLATGVGALTLAMLLWAWTMHWRKSAASSAREAISVSPWWPTAIFVWTCVQGAFGALTVTMKLFPAIVTLHLLGGYTLLALLTAQLVLLGQSSAANHVPFALKVGMCFGLAVLVVQAASGAWVSTNYAVLACTEFPQCQGQWVPPMNFSQAFELWRPLGQTAAGEAISFQALTAIHVTHRTLAALALVVLGLVAYSAHQHQPLRRPARYLAGLLALQIITGLSNVVLDWPMLAAVVHTGGAGAMVAVMVWMLAITLAPQQGRSSQ
jgi:cytochrome c oxidase assembly protein subunit 15